MIKVPVTLRKVTKRFGRDEKEIVAVDRFTHEFEASKLVTLLGPSGCGKTTTLRCIAGFYEPEEGDIILGGRRVNNIPPYSRPTGTVFQNYALFPHMTVFENIAYGLKIKKLPAPEIKKIVQRGLDLLQLSGMENRTPDQLSGGQQQRVAIARVLVNEPQVLLFDEPLSNLDAKLRVYMRGEIRSLQENLGITTIYVTHDQEEAMSLSDTMVVMNEGRIEQVGSPQEIYRRPATDFVANFIGMTNSLKGIVKSIEGNLLSLSVADALVKLRTDDRFEIGEEVTIVSRPEMLKFSKAGPSAVRGVVKNTFFLGSLARYEIQVGKGELITLDDSNPTNLRAKGTNVNIEIILDSVYVKKMDDSI